MTRLCVALVLMAALLVAVLSGCAQVSDPVSSPAASPEEVARNYLELLFAGDTASARRLVWRPNRFSGPSDFLEGASIMRLSESEPDSAAGRPPEYLELHELRILTADLRTSQSDEAGNPPGSYMLFVLLGRENAKSPWLVVETGTGP